MFDWKDSRISKPVRKNPLQAWRRAFDVQKRGLSAFLAEE
jgi:hypothetical protein